MDWCTNYRSKTIKNLRKNVRNSLCVLGLNNNFLYMIPGAQKHKNYNQGLEKQLHNEESLLYFQRTLVKIPAFTLSGSQLSLTPDPD